MRDQRGSSCVPTPACAARSMFSARRFLWSHALRPPPCGEELYPRGGGRDGCCPRGPSIFLTSNTRSSPPPCPCTTPDFKPLESRKIIGFVLQAARKPQFEDVLR